MKTEKKIKYVVIVKGKEKIYDDIQKAEEVKTFWIEEMETHAAIEQREVEEKTIEKGDRVMWVKTDRQDIVTKITKNMWGDICYMTEEIGGNKRGMAGINDIILV